MTDTTLLGPWVRRFLLEYLVTECNLARNTQRSYRDTLCLLIPFVAQHARKEVDQISVIDVSSDVVRLFLQHLEECRKCGVATRNQRLAAIHSLARFVGLHSPEHIVWCGQLRTIPPKRAPRSTVTYLEKSEMDALLNAPNTSTDQGRRDHALLLFLYNTGARADQVAQTRIADLALAHTPRDHSLVQVRGKGNKLRRCPLWPQTVTELSSLTGSRQATDHVFLNRCGDPITRFGIHTMVERHVQRILPAMPSIAGKRVSPHTIRHYAGFRTIPGELVFGPWAAVLRVFSRHSPGRVFLTGWSRRRTLMEQVFKNHRLCEQGGPLGPYIEGYAAEMSVKGYARHTMELQIRLVADFGRWLAKRQIQVQKITAELFQPYLRARGRRRRPTGHDLSALQRLLDLLERQGVVSAPLSPAATPAERLQAEFRLYLQQERALASTTQNCYLTFVSEFLAELFGAGPVDLSGLCAADVTGFVRRRAVTIQSKRVQLMTTALRSFLRFARYRGDIDKDLAACVPAVANWKLSTIPRALPPDQVELVLASIDRKTAMGRRDYAILLTLARLGLRAGEIRALTLEDLDWQEGLITVRGKAGRYSQLPLPADVGAAIADYLRHGRPTASSRCVFLRAKAPAGGFKGQSGIGSLVRHALGRAGIEASRTGAHQFRHALACQMLRQGASLSEIGELLRHRSPQTTAIYAKVDMASLATLALPWPGGAR